MAHLMPAVSADAPVTTTRSRAEAPPLEERFRAGEAGALEDVISTYQPNLTRLVHRLTGWSTADVEDIVQEVFVSALRSARAFDGRSSLWTWLTRIAINRCRSDGRKRALRLRHWGRLVFHWPTETGAAPGAAGEVAGRVTQEVRRLPAKYREVVVLRYLEEMGVEEIGRVLKLSRAAVEVRLHRARQMLRETLADVWSEQ